MPDAGMFAAADQITVAGHDLALVLTSDEGESGGGVRLRGGGAASGAGV